MTEAARAPGVREPAAPGEEGPAGGEGPRPRGFVLAHLSDPHVPTRLDAGPHRLLNKRVFGYLSWRFRRARIHRREVLEALARDLAALRPDHVAVTGDIVNIALPHEFTRAAEWLRTLGDPARVTVVPGNHDAYVAIKWERSWAAWGDFMSSDGGGPGSGRADDEAGAGSPVAAIGREWFPVFRRRGLVALVGLSTAVPTAPGHSSGRIGKAQLERAEDRLRAAGSAGLFRVVLLHHPPQATNAPHHKRLTDAGPFCEMIARSGAELVLHGHEHRFRREEIGGPHGPVPVFGVPSASMLPNAHGTTAQYHVHHIEAAGGHWALSTRVHTYSDQHGSDQHGRFVESRRLEACLPRRPVPSAR